MHTRSRAWQSYPALLLTVLLGCSSSTPPPDKPTSPSPDPAETAPPEASASSEPATEGEPAPKKKSSKDAVPDDYELTNRDCDDLGKQLASLIRGDLAAKLSPKLKEKQREQAMSSIDNAAVRRQDEWIEGCQKDLVGKTVDRQTLKCAMGSKTVKDFDACLNGPPPDAAATK